LSKPLAPCVGGCGTRLVHDVKTSECKEGVGSTVKEIAITVSRTEERMVFFASENIQIKQEVHGEGKGPKTSLKEASGPPLPAGVAAGAGDGADVTTFSLRQRPPAEIVAELRGNLDLIQKMYAAYGSDATEQGKLYHPPAPVARCMLDAAEGIKLWLCSHRASFNAEELNKKISMLMGIHNKCVRGELDDKSSQKARIDALACWVELTKTYYICIRESRNLSRRGVANIKAVSFRLPDTVNYVPPPRPLEESRCLGEFARCMGEFFTPPSPNRKRQGDDMHDCVSDQQHAVDEAQHDALRVAASGEGARKRDAEERAQLPWREQMAVYWSRLGETINPKP